MESKQYKNNRKKSYISCTCQEISSKCTESFPVHIEFTHFNRIYTVYMAEFPRHFQTAGKIK